MTKKTSPAYRASKEETIPINKLHPFSNHPFHIRHDLEFSELVDSISESGIITPIIVRPKVGVGYEVISGHRRWEACKELGIESIPARVEYIDDAQIPQMAKKLVEVIGVDRVRPHTYTQRDGYTWVQVEKDMHITEWLYAHELCSSLQFTRFLNRDGRELFQVRDGQRVIETNADGTKRLRAVKNIDVTHAYVGHYGCHIQQYAEDNFRIGCYVAPEHPQPGDNLDKLQVYQITKGGCEYRFMNYAYSKSRIHAADYSSVYIANLPADYDLDRCFQEFNAPNRPLRYHMCSLSTSDIVVTTKNGNETAYYVDSIGFKDVSHLLPELHEVEAQHQKEQVQDEPER